MTTQLPPPAATDQVGVFDQNFNQVFPNARPIKAVVKEEAKPMEHPLENGSIIIDHRIILPVEIELSLITQADNYQDVYNQIRQLYLNGTLLVVHTKSGVYSNQFITSMPHEETPDEFDVLVIALKLKQAQIVNSQNSSITNNTTKQPQNSSTVDRGNLQPQTPKKSSALLEGVTKIFGGV